MCCTQKFGPCIKGESNQGGQLTQALDIKEENTQKAVCSGKICLQVYRKSRAPKANSRLVYTQTSHPACITERTNLHEKSLKLGAGCKLITSGSYNE